MTLTLELLAERYVFQSSPFRHDLGALHVPFDILTGTPTTEQRFHDAVHRHERTALIGAAGSGKSSVIAHVLGPTAVGVAPLVVPLAAMPASSIDTPAHLVDHLLAMITRLAGTAAATEIGDQAATRTETVSTSHTLGGAAGWGWLKGNLAREVQRQTEVERHATITDKTDAIVQVLDLIALDDLQPVLVFDDTDRWLRNGGRELVRAFFGEGVRWLIELPASIVVAVHPDYFDHVPRADLLQYIDTQIAVPPLTEPASIEAILARRIEQYAEVERPNLRDVLTEDMPAAVLNVYQEAGSIRRALQVCHTALSDAINGGADALTAGHIVAAAQAG